MRILVLDTNVAYANPTSGLLLEELAMQADVLFAGIGYNLDSSSLKNLEKKFGKIDVILGQTWMFGEAGVGQFGEFVPVDLRDHPAPKILNLLQVDPHSIPEYIYNNCVVPSDFVLTAAFCPEWKKPDSRFSANRETWYDPSNFYARTPSLVDEKWVMLPHCIASDEFVFNPKKRWDVIIPGANYYFRAKSKECMQVMEGISIAPMGGIFQRGLYWASSYYVAQKHLNLTKLFYRRFQKKISRSKLAITCDGSVGYAIRKFFEIPAFGTLLAGRFFPEMKSLGFESGINCLALPDNDHEKLEEAVRFAKSDSAEMRTIVNVGQEMIREFHNSKIRGKQLLEVLERVAKKNFRQLYWKNGKPDFSGVEPR